MSRFGPATYHNFSPTVAMGKEVVVIGSPHQKLSPYYFVNVSSIEGAEDWQQSVQQLIASAHRIFVACGTQQWVQWEIRKVCELGRIGQTVFLFPAGRVDAYVALLPLIDPAGLFNLQEPDLQKVVALFFVSEYEVVLVETEKPSAGDLIHAVYVARYAAEWADRRQLGGRPASQGR